MGIVKAICISEKKGTQKHRVEEAVFVEDWALKRTPMPENGTAR